MNFQIVYDAVILDKHVLMSGNDDVCFVLIVRDGDDDVFSDATVPAKVYYETDCAIGSRVKCIKTKDGGFFGNDEYEYIFERGK